MLKAMTNLVEKVTVEEKEQEVVISVSQIYAPITVDWKIIVKAEYHIQADGLITMSYHGVPTGVQLPESFPRTVCGLCWIKPVNRQSGTEEDLWKHIRTVKKATR